MKMIYEYTSEFSNDCDTEHWTRIIDTKLGENKSDSISPINKLPAEYCAKLYLSDFPIIEIICASRGREKVSVNHCYKDKFYIIFSNREQNKYIISSNSYDWDKCIEIAKKYRNIIFEKLENILKKSDKFYIRTTNHHLINED